MDNSDTNCFCGNETFVASVYGCLSAWGSDNSEIQQAVSYLVGICAPQIPSNPGIITNCPKSIPIAPTSPPATSIAVAPSVDVTTVIVDTTVTTCPVGATITTANATTVLQSPHVSTAYSTRTITTCTACGKAGPTAPAAPVQPYSVITIPGLSTTCTVPVVTFVTTTAAGGSSQVILAPTGSAGSGVITGGVYSWPTSTGLATATMSNNHTTTAAPQPFLGAAPKTSSTWIAGSLLAFVGIVFTL
jgi:hypothetical protein